MDDNGVMRLRSVVALAIVLAGCAAPVPEKVPMTASEGRALVARYLPPKLADRSGWATDIYAAFATLRIEPTPRNICSVVAVTEQESGFQVDPAVPNLGAIAWKEIEKQRERLGIPKLVLEAALALPSTNGKSYRERIDSAHTEHDLSDTFEDFIGRVPLGRRLLEDRNPVHTVGPMQVSVVFAKEQAAFGYPYPIAGTIRDELFTRRGGMYFGIAHLLDYRAPYDSDIYRFADFNAGRYSSRNAAFQNALSEISGLPVTPDGALLRFSGSEPVKDASSTELAARAVAERLHMDSAEIRRDLELVRSPDFERSRLYTRVFEIADRSSGKVLPRAALPRIELHSSKITRTLTTEWFAKRAAERQRNCLARGERL